MKLIGLMSWFDESPRWLSEAIESHHPAGLTHLVAVDGAYALFPGGRAHSGSEQHRAISKTCERLGIASTIHTPSTVWAGNEVQKRSFMFELGLTVADGPQDWLVVIDSDHVMTHHDDLRARLSESDLHAAEFTAWQHIDPPKTRELNVPRVHEYNIRLAYRANPGLRCHGNHYTYVDDQGRVLWGQRDCVPALDLTHVRVEHRTMQRVGARHNDQYAYYNRRAEERAEFQGEHVCDWEGCDQKPIKSVPFGFERIQGTDALKAGAINVCEKHLRRAHYENRSLLGSAYGREGELLERHT